MSNKINYNLFIVYYTNLEKEKNISKNHSVRFYNYNALQSKVNVSIERTLKSDQINGVDGNDKTKCKRM